MGNSYSCGDVVDGKRGRTQQVWPADPGVRELYRAVLVGDAEALSALHRQGTVNLREVEKNVPVLVLSSEQLRGASPVLGAEKLELLREFLQGDYTRVCQRKTYLCEAVEECVYIIGMTPLQVASMAGHASCVSALLRMGADPEARETRFRALERNSRRADTIICPLSPLQLAAANGHEDCLGNLLDSTVPEAPPVAKRCRTTAVAHVSQTPPLHLAAGLDRPDCLKMLISRGANLEERDKTDMEETFGRRQIEENATLQKLLQYAYGSVDGSLGLPGMTALCRACKTANAACLEVLLEQGADCSAPVGRKESPLHVLCTHGVRYKNRNNLTDDRFVECLRLLLNHGSNYSDGTDIVNELVSKILSENLPEGCLICCARLLMNCVSFSAKRTEVEIHEHYQWRPLTARTSIAGERQLGKNRQQVVAVPLSAARSAAKQAEKSKPSTERQFMTTFFSTNTEDQERIAVPEGLVEAIVVLQSQPRGLVDLSRLAIRRGLFGQVQRNIGQLKLPTALKNFVLLKDVHCEQKS